MMDTLNIKAIEEEISAYWKKHDIEKKFKEKNSKKQKFYFCQGPPFTSGEAHLGHAWNHVIKDAIIRFKTAQGFDVFKRAGWDMHGLPIEVKVENALNIKNKKEINAFGIDKFIDECRNFSVKNMQSMTMQLKSLAVWLDWDNPYQTINIDYMESVWYGIKKAYDKGLLYEKERVIHWCPRCETAMAGYEVTDGYKEVTDNSVYVKVKIKPKNREKEELDEKFIIIWTTTPWTLPANVAIAVHPEYEYVLLEHAGEKLICAKDAISRIFGSDENNVKNVKNGNIKILETFKGCELEGLEYESILNMPIQESINHRIVLAKNLVTSTEGSGCVHIAPGHGEEDAEIGRIYGLVSPSPVDESGKFNIQPYLGINVRDANQIIINDLKKCGKLLKEEKITHTYPHCWRCKTPLILRKTKQWFLAVSKIKDNLISENKAIEWIPSFIGHGGNSRFENWLQNAEDWCISRQRYWNTPLPVWKCSECENIEVIGSIDELKSMSGVSEIKDLHKNTVDRIEIKCNKCGRQMKRVIDVMDVWLDSGSASWANIGYPKNKDALKIFPIDFITEGSDQTRGWFYSLLVLGVIVFNKAPYKKVLYHGFTLDEKGQKMSKSLGNVISHLDVLKKYGVDVFRFYVLTPTPWEDLKFSWKDVEESEKTLNILLNAYNFTKKYAEIDNYIFNKKSREKCVKFEIEDLWIISRINFLVKKSIEELENAHVHEVVKLINEFINDLSRWYIKIIRDRAWIYTGNESKESAYYTLHYVLRKLIGIMCFIVPHLSEFIYINLFAKSENELSIHLTDLVSYEENFINKELENKFEIVKEVTNAVLSLREKAKIKLRWPVKEIKISLTEKIDLSEVEPIIKKLCNAEHILYEKEKFKIKVKVNYASLGKKFREKTNEVVKDLNKVETEILKNEIEKNKKILINGNEITKEDIIFETVLPEGVIAEKFNYGVLYLNTQIDENLYKKAMGREVIRRIQEMRKEINLNELEVRECFIECSDKMRKYIEENKAYIEIETRTKINFGAGKGEESYEKEWEIENEKIKFFVNKKT